jgi:hypothetical protein
MKKIGSFSGEKQPESVAKAKKIKRHYRIRLTLQWGIPDSAFENVLYARLEAIPTKE